MRVRVLVAGIAAVLFGLVAAGSASAANPASIVGQTKISDRLWELTVDTPAFTEPTKLHVFLPTGYANSSKNWPVTYFTAGTQNNYDSFANFLDGENLTKDFPSIIVSPDGNSGYWSDWYNGGNFGAPMYETFVIDQLIPLIDKTYRTIPDRAHRAIFGISMGGYGAMSLAAKHPDLFGAAGTISGAVDSNNPLIGAAVSFSSTFDGGAIDAIYGPRATEEVRWRGSNPTDLVSNLKGMDLQVRSANGTLNPGIGEGDNPNDALSCLVESGVYQGSTSFHDALTAANVPHTWADYGDGCHTPENFTRETIDTLTSLTQYFEDPPAAPRKFTYLSIQPEFSVWGWQLMTDPDRALEFMEMSSAGNSLTLKGSGMTTVTSPPIYKGLTAVDVNGKPIRPAAGGRLNFQVNLGAAHTVQQYRPGAADTFVSKTVTFKPHAVIRILVAKRVGLSIRFCAKSDGTVIPRAQIKAGRSAWTLKLTGTKSCWLLGPARKSGKLTVTGKDIYGHRVSASRKISGRS